MSNYLKHYFHLVDESPWPLIRIVGGIRLALGLVEFFYFFKLGLCFKRLILLLVIMVQWWGDVTREGAFQGFHREITLAGLRLGIILFILSEVCFFFSFFWAFFHSSFVTPIELGGIWPPTGIVPLQTFQVPLLNTLILVRRGITVTWAHHRLIDGLHSQVSRGIWLTVILGVYFSFLQGLEYQETSFTIADRNYGGTFFLITGFHGFHVLVGSIFLIVVLMRAKKAHFRSDHHFGFEAAAWYWHFVDVVWLFLFVAIYWWGRV